jgi:hypothetical protein
MTWDEIRKAMGLPFQEVRFRIGSRNRDKTKGMVLTYIDARDLMHRLDDVVGSGNWTTEFREVAGRVVCRLGVRPDESQPFVYKEDGAGETDMEGEKGALSDAFKRAGVHFGAARYLYNEPNTWVQLEGEGKWIAKGEEERAYAEYTKRHFGVASSPQRVEEREPEPEPRREPEPEPAPQRDVGSEVEQAQALILERKKMVAKQFGLAEKLWGKPIPSERRFQIMDWVLGKMGLRVQKQIDSIEKCRQAMRWIDEYELNARPDAPPRF